jgi:hypothetical protein
MQLQIAARARECAARACACCSCWHQFKPRSSQTVVSNISPDKCLHRHHNLQSEIRVLRIHAYNRYTLPKLEGLMLLASIAASFPPPTPSPSPPLPLSLPPLSLPTSFPSAEDVLSQALENRLWQGGWLSFITFVGFRWWDVDGERFHLPCDVSSVCGNPYT